MLGLGGQFGKRYLMRAEGAFDLLPVHYLGTGPAFGRAQHDHGPHAALREAQRTGLLLNGANVRQHAIERAGQRLVYLRGVVAFDKIGLVAVAFQKAGEFLVGNARQHRRPGDLISVQVQDRQHRAVAGRIEEFVGMPAGGQGSGLRFSIADHAAGQQVRIVEDRAKGVRQRIAQFSALVNRAGSLGRRVARNAARK